MKRKKTGGQPEPLQNNEDNNQKVILFQETEIRRVWHEGAWWFVIEDIVKFLTNSINPKGYIRDMRRRDVALTKGWGQIAHPLSVETTGGKQRINCANTEGVLRLIMSIPSPKAEPFKLWLARLGKEHIEEIENPELGIERLKELYRAKGYADEWIESRMKSIDVRKQLTNEWQQRGVKEGLEYAILTAEISKATFGITPTEYQTFKGLDRHNLRDHMTNLELIFTMLGEESTRMTAVEEDAQGFVENQEAAQKGGRITGNALKLYEKQSGRKISTKDNFLKQIEVAKLKITEGSAADVKNAAENNKTDV